MTELATIDPQGATPAQMRDYAIAVRDIIPRLNTDLLQDLEAVLVAIAKRLRSIGLDASEAERSRTLAMQRYGELLGPAEIGRPGKGTDFSTFPGPLSQAEKNRRAEARLLAEQPDAVAEILARDKVTLNRAIVQARQRRHETDAAAAAPGTAIVELAHWRDWLPAQQPCDLLLTDPPYSTDVDNVYDFAEDWLPAALKTVKPTGRAYVCVGAYPAELHAYLSVPAGDLTLANVLVWTYRNTMGPSPTYDYLLNWQAILYYRGPDAPPLDCPRLTEQFAVHDISAPGGGGSPRMHAWQKPDELANRIIRHSTRQGDTILDPFAGTGTFLAAAARLGRNGYGCDTDPAMIAIAETRGCRA